MQAAREGMREMEEEKRRRKRRKERERWGQMDKNGLKISPSPVRLGSILQGVDFF